MDKINPIPDGIEISAQGGTQTLVRRWYTPMVWLYLLICLFWNGFMVFWYHTALSASSPNLMVILFPLLHVGIGVWLVYRTLAGFFNVTTVRVSGSTVSIRHRPFPWPGNRDFPSQDIKQVFCDEKRYRNETSQGVTYRVNVVCRDGRKRVLIGGGGLQKDQALYLATEIERRLGIRHEPVVGEIV